MKLAEIEQNRYALLRMERKKLPTKMIVAIVRNLDVLDAKYHELDRVRLALLDECAAKDRKGKYITEKDEAGQEKVKLTKDGEKKFREEWTKALEADYDIRIVPITTADLEACEDPRYDTLTVGEVRSLAFMLQ